VNLRKEVIQMFIPYQNYYSFSSWYYQQPQPQLPPFMPQPFIQEEVFGPEANFVQNITPAFPGPQSYVQGQTVYPQTTVVGPSFVQGQMVAPTPTQGYGPTFIQGQMVAPTPFQGLGPNFIQGQTVTPPQGQLAPFPAGVRNDDRKDIKKEVPKVIHPIVIEEKPEKAEVKPIEIKIENKEMPKPKIEIKKEVKPEVKKEIDIDIKKEVKVEKEEIKVMPDLEIEYKEINMKPVVEKEFEMTPCYPCFPFFLPSQKCKKPIYPIIEPICPPTNECACPPINECGCPPHSYIKW
jgi:hypothetical protein